MKKADQQVQLSLRVPRKLRKEIEAIRRRINSSTGYPINYSEAARRVLMRGVKAYQGEER